MPKKFTFKTEKQTGRFAWIHDPEHLIKMDKKVVGRINHKDHKISLIVMKKDIMEDLNPNCEWRWVRLVNESASLEEAKKFLNDKFEEINKLYNLHGIEY